MDGAKQSQLETKVFPPYQSPGEYHGIDLGPIILKKHFLQRLEVDEDYHQRYLQATSDHDPTFKTEKKVAASGVKKQESLQLQQVPKLNKPIDGLQQQQVTKHFQPVPPLAAPAQCEFVPQLSSVQIKRRMCCNAAFGCNQFADDCRGFTPERCTTYLEGRIQLPSSKEKQQEERRKANLKRQAEAVAAKRQRKKEMKRAENDKDKAGTTDLTFKKNVAASGGKEQEVQPLLQDPKLKQPMEGLQQQPQPVPHLIVPPSQRVFVQQLNSAQIKRRKCCNAAFGCNQFAQDCKGFTPEACTTYLTGCIQLPTKEERRTAMLKRQAEARAAKRQIEKEMKRRRKNDNDKGGSADPTFKTASKVAASGGKEQEQQQVKSAHSHFHLLQLLPKENLFHNSILHKSRGASVAMLHLDAISLLRIVEVSTQNHAPHTLSGTYSVANKRRTENSKA